MKRMTYFVMALAFGLRLHPMQERTTHTPTPRRGVRITLNVNKNGNSSKGIVDPTCQTDK